MATGTLSASEAYRQAGYSHTDADGAAHRLSVKVGIGERIASIRAKIREKRGVTQESLADEYDEALEMGRDQKQPTAMVSATTGKARLYGLDKQVIEQGETHKDLTTTEAEQARDYAQFKLWQASRGETQDGSEPNVVPIAG
ncbi:hypothetical protein LCGC14_0376960 [marine sediment metagenome]|uniref:Terminase small subunit n=1 Tax=marine sediment metagenome TaxID=412755 RepID=A0A0F9T3L0_9ZZZZ